ncbi:SH3 domain-containing protein [Enterococcus dispar]|uniref:SH3 domain-containing protein n=1 Tax=Enterococcus dispar TaxID=44009 RepID=UPI00232C6A82|nr:SH3 domain-containing protein [Enterococcus dispar]WCG33965.1 SH3 domain-containing protein [Enterococcus dispar]
MKKLKSVLMSLVVVVTMAVPSLGIGLSASAYTVEQNYIGNGAPAGYTLSNDYIILHEAGNPTNTGADSLDREVSYMKRNWQNAFVSYFVGSGGRVVKLAQDGAYQYGAGATANGRAYAQIELARTNNKATFQKDYKVYVNLARDLAKRSGIPKTLDTAGQGIKSHQWVSLNIWGDHMDPYSYLASWGISKAQLAADLKSGFTIPEKPPVEPETPKPGTETPKPEKPTVSYEAKNGTYVFTTETKIRNGLGLTGYYSGVNYKSGQSVNYDRIYKGVDGYDWLSYVSYSGQRRYVAMINSYTPPANSGWTSENATFTAGTTINVRSAATTAASVVAEYSAGQSVNYEAKKASGGYIWIRYTSYSGQKRYMAVRTYQNGVRGKLWGTIK